jgi:hypothetical protein
LALWRFGALALWRFGAYDALHNNEADFEKIVNDLASVESV